MTQTDHSRIYGIISRILVLGSIVLALTAKSTPAPTAAGQIAAVLFVLGCALWGDYQQARRIAALEQRVAQLEQR